MKAALLKYWDALWSSYWFIPSMMAVSAFVLAFAFTALDDGLGASWLFDRLSWLHAIQPEGARTLLSTIAGSMVTVAGVTFSITIAAVAYASGQFGPRILTNFMQDRGNQITLGTFIATFLYCLLILRSVRSGDSSSGANGLDALVPQLSSLFALVLALASLGVLIYFIHHIPDTIHVSHVIARIGHELNGKVESIFPEGAGLDEEGPACENMSSVGEEALSIAAPWSGYVHNIDLEGLYTKACKHDIGVEVVAHPGHYVAKGQALLRAWPRSRVDENVSRALAAAYACGNKRTAVQDPLFLVDELVEIAARALSPGVNDPFTAISCVDWFSSALAAYSRRTLPGPYRYDADGRLRVFAAPVSFDIFASRCFDQLRPYFSGDRNAAIHMMTVIGKLIHLVRSDAQREILHGKALALSTASEEKLQLRADKEDVAAAFEDVHSEYISALQSSEQAEPA